MYYHECCGIQVNKPKYNFVILIYVRLQSNYITVAIPQGNTRTCEQKNHEGINLEVG